MHSEVIDYGRKERRKRDRTLTSELRKRAVDTAPVVAHAYEVRRRCHLFPSYLDGESDVYLITGSISRSISVVDYCIE